MVKVEHKEAVAALAVVEVVALLDGGATDATAKKPKASPAKPKEEDVDRGEPPEGAPGVEEIEQLISDRNACRKRGEYTKADEIRDDLKTRGVVLSDEKGAHGDGLTVTSWRYWHS